MHKTLNCIHNIAIYQSKNKNKKICYISQDHEIIAFLLKMISMTENEKDIEPV